jgi:hypothetical protein
MILTELKLAKTVGEHYLFQAVLPGGSILIGPVLLQEQTYTNH